MGDVSTAASVMCRQCGYDLRGSDPEGCCPECGMLVGRGGGLVACGCLFAALGLWIGIARVVLLIGFRRALADEAAEAALRWNNRPG